MRISTKKKRPHVAPSHEVFPSKLVEIVEIECSSLFARSLSLSISLSLSLLPFLASDSPNQKTDSPNSRMWCTTAALASGSTLVSPRGTPSGRGTLVQRYSSSSTVSAGGKVTSRVRTPDEGQPLAGSKGGGEEGEVVVAWAEAMLLEEATMATKSAAAEQAKRRRPPRRTGLLLAQQPLLRREDIASGSASKSEREGEPSHGKRGGSAGVERRKKRKNGRSFNTLDVVVDFFSFIRKKQMKPHAARLAGRPALHPLRLAARGPVRIFSTPPR